MCKCDTQQVFWRVTMDDRSTAASPMQQKSALKLACDDEQGSSSKKIAKVDNAVEIVEIPVRGRARKAQRARDSQHEGLPDQP